MRKSILLPAALLGLAGCAVPVQVPAGSQVTAASISPAPAGSLSPTMTATYVTPATTTYVATVPTTTQYVVPAVLGAGNPSQQ